MKHHRRRCLTSYCQLAVHLRVHVFVPLTAPHFVNRLPHHGNGQHKTLGAKKKKKQDFRSPWSYLEWTLEEELIYQRGPVCVQISNFQRRYKLGTSHHQEVEVKEELELLIENLEGQKDGGNMKESCSSSVLSGAGNNGSVASCHWRSQVLGSNEPSDLQGKCIQLDSIWAYSIIQEGQREMEAFGENIYVSNRQLTFNGAVFLITRLSTL